MTFNINMETPCVFIFYCSREFLLTMPFSIVGHLGCVLFFFFFCYKQLCDEHFWAFVCSCLRISRRIFKLSKFYCQIGLTEPLWCYTKEFSCLPAHPPIHLSVHPPTHPYNLYWTADYVITKKNILFVTIPVTEYGWVLSSLLYRVQG